MAKRKSIPTAIQGPATTTVPILPPPFDDDPAPPSKRRASQRRAPQPNPDTGSTNPDKNAIFLDAPEALRASPDGDETMNLEEAGMDVEKQVKKDDSEATPQGMSSDADMDPEHSTAPKPNNLPCMFTVEVFQEPDSEPSCIVRPTAIWNSLERFKVFAMGDQNYRLHDIVTVTRHDLPKSPLWTATILEIRGHKASSQAFIRLYWFYRPTQLPPSLRHPYHGRSEVLASNTMAVIDATAVAGRAHVYHWHEELEDVPPAVGLFWRQTYDVQTQSLSPLHTPCPPPCIQHHNPDSPLTTCPLPNCKARMHKSCILDATSTDLQAKAEAEAEAESESESEAGAETEAAASVSPRDKKGKKKVPSLLVDWIGALVTERGPGEEGDGHYWLEDMHCLGCGGSFSGW